MSITVYRIRDVAYSPKLETKDVVRLTASFVFFAGWEARRMRVGIRYYVMVRIGRGCLGGRKAEACGRGCCD